MKWIPVLKAELEKDSADQRTVDILTEFWSDDTAYEQDVLVDIVALADAIAAKFNLSPSP